jgi:hypothetical protein
MDLLIRDLVRRTCAHTAFPSLNQASFSFVRLETMLAENISKTAQLSVLNHYTDLVSEYNYKVIAAERISHKKRCSIHRQTINRENGLELSSSPQRSISHETQVISQAPTSGQFENRGENFAKSFVGQDLSG